MKKKSLLILISISFFMNWNCIGQENIIYHEFEPTASDFAITKWNVDKNENSGYYLSEIIDSKNRVIELKFYEKGENDFEHLCYLSTWIKFEYPDDQTVIQYYLNSKGIPEANIECEIPSKTIYHLSADQREIIKSESKYEFNKKHYLEIGWTEEFIKDVLNNLESEQKTDFIINYYSKSSTKLNGIFPVSKEFELEHFYFNEIEIGKVKCGIE